MPDVKDRQHLLTLHKKAKKIGLDLNQYNHLKEEVRYNLEPTSCSQIWFIYNLTIAMFITFQKNKLEKDIARLRDPLQIHLPPSYVEKLTEDKRSPLSKIKDMLEETSKKMKIT